MEKTEVKRRGFEELQNHVLLKDLCTSCGTCVITCPFKEVLDYTPKGPSLAGECTKCGICLRVCPRYELEVRDLEQMVFGRERRPEEIFGLSKTVCVARSTCKDILETCQDGGVATTLLSSAFTSGAIDGAALSGIDPSNPWLPKPLLATTLDEIVESAGTRYSYSPNLLAYNAGVAEGLEKIAFVGTPCQVLALRRIQKASLRKHSRALALTIGLFCSECFSYEGLMIQKIQGEMGIDLRAITKMNIKGGLILQTKSGKTTKIPLRDAKRYAESACQYCSDFSAELADISLGGIGLEGWTLTIIRTDKGEDFFSQTVNKGLLEVKPIEDFESAFNLLKKLSKIKRNKAEKNKKERF
jgi:coenzyme F420 hydrogenase subunit beta